MDCFAHRHLAGAGSTVDEIVGDLRDGAHLAAQQQLQANLESARPETEAALATSRRMRNTPDAASRTVVSGRASRQPSRDIAQRLSGQLRAVPPGT
jgi:hypothetical protein